MSFAPTFSPGGDSAAPDVFRDTVSSVAFGGNRLLAAASWSKEVVVWDCAGGEGVLGRLERRARVETDAPVLSCAFSPDARSVVTGSCDHAVRIWDLGSNKVLLLGVHSAPVRHVFFVGELNAVVSGGWDSTLRVFDARAPSPVRVIVVPDKVYAMDVTFPLATVGCAGRSISVFALNELQRGPVRVLESPLRMQTRCVANFTDRTGFLVGSIEGRCGVQYISEAQKNFAFKCHRQNEEAFAVNCAAFHPNGAFATGGSDGHFTFWNKDTKQRLQQFPNRGQPITSCAFNQSGSLFAYAVGYDWSMGAQFHDPALKSGVFVHVVADAEIQRPR
jgi:mRNA export factor